MLKLTLKGTSWDGEYELDLDTLNGREMHLVKQVSGVRLGEFEDALLASDYDLYVAFSAICVVRSGKVSKEGSMLIADSLMECEAGAIRAEWQDDAVPPTPAPPEPSESSASSSTPSGGALADPLAMSLASTGASA